MSRVLITGGSSGIGKQLALDYTAKGYEVIVCGRNASRLAEIAAATNAKTLCFDTTDLAATREACHEVEALDLLILNAGQFELMKVDRSFDGAAFEKIIRVNLLGMGNCLDALVGRVKSGGQIALMGSSSAIFGFSRAEAYGTSKAAVAYLAEALRADLMPAKIDVTLIEPGFIDTPLVKPITFMLPFLLSVDAATKRIVNGLTTRRPRIAFPRRTVWVLQFASLLPLVLRKHLAHLVSLGYGVTPLSRVEKPTVSLAKLNNE